MSQADQDVSNATFPSVRADINDNIKALFSQSSGNSAPAVTVAFQPWVDTSSSPPVWKVRNGSNSAWITVGVLDPAGFNAGGITAIANGGTGATTATAALAALLPSQSGNAGKALVTDGSAATWNTVSGITNGTAVASTSGTAIDFTSIPSTAKKVIVMFNGVSTNGTSVVQVQIGSGTVSTTSYYATASNFNSNLNLSSGFPLDYGVNAVAANTRSGLLMLTLLGSNTWVGSGSSASQSSTGTVLVVSFAGRSSSLSGTLDRVRITTVNGTDSFDAGTINISWAS